MKLQTLCLPVFFMWVKPFNVMKKSLVIQWYTRNQYWYAVKNSIKLTMGKLLSAMLHFVMYCVLNIYEGILMSALPVVAHCQNKYKCFALSVQLYCSTAHKTLLANQYQRCMPRQTLLKLVHYCTLLSMGYHFDAHIITLRVTFRNKTG